MKNKIILIIAALLVVSAPVCTNASIEDLETYFTDASNFDHELTFAEYGSNLNIVDIFNSPDYESPDYSEKVHWVTNKLSDVAHEQWFDYSNIQLITYNARTDGSMSSPFIYDITVKTGVFQWPDYNNESCGIIKNKSDLSDAMLSGVQGCINDILNGRIQNDFVFVEKEDFDIEWFGKERTGIFANVTGTYKDSNEKEYSFTTEFTFTTQNNGTNGEYSEIYTEVNDVVLFGEYIETYNYHLTRE